MLITDDGYALTYYKEMNQIIIGLPQTMRTLNRTMIKVSNRKVDLTPSEEAYILNTVRVVFGETAERISNAPTVDAEPVRRGHWIVMPLKVDRTADATAFYEPIVCSVCGSQNNCESAYCPNCGAKMDGGEDG